MNRLIRPVSLAGITTAWLLTLTAVAQQPDVLRPEAAFPYTAEAGTDTITVQFDVPDGYYLYRQRFGFASDTAAVSIGDAEFPSGEIHEDEFFGEQEIYRGQFDVVIPYSNQSATDEMSLEVRLQGCADIGLCYPPQRWFRDVTLPANPAGSIAGQASRDFVFGSAAEDSPLPPEQAFDVNIRFDGANQMTVGFQIEPGYYLYRDKFEFSAVGDIGLGSPSIPDGVDHYDQNFGDTEVFYDYVEIDIPFSRASPDGVAVTVQTVFQGCKEDSICYPPMDRSLDLTVPPSSQFAGEIDSAPATRVSEQDFLANVILTGSWWVVLGTFYALGLGLAFTPCVLPMVPILSSIIAGGNNASAARGFSLSVAYVLGMAVTYTVAGALAAMAGQQIQAIFQQPWIIGTFAAMFVVLSLGMFGVYELQLPAAVQTRLAGLANRQQGGTYVGTAIMGALSALIVTACVAPPLIATLAVMGQSGDVIRGASALFALSIGMGSPLLVVGASAGSILPRAGAWMNLVKGAFGVMMLGVAIWMLDRILSGNVTLLLWALLVFLSGVFLGAFDPLPAQPTPPRRLAKGVGVLACLYGAMMLIGAMLGGENPLRPIPQSGLFAAGDGAVQQDYLQFRDIETLAALESALAEARAVGQPVMIDFTAEWCVSCKEMEEYTFPDAGVIAALEPFLLLRADVTENDADDQELLSYFNSYGPPTIAFFDTTGEERNPYRLVGYVPAEEFAAHVSEVAAL